jgi:hypothetical protein
VDGTGFGYIEAKAGVVKSTQAKKAKRKALHVAGHAQDLEGRGWAATWQAIRESEGLDARRDMCMQPKPLKDGGWAHARMSSAELSAFVRGVLKDAPGRGQGRITAHTFKGTYLSWCAKYGLKRGVRRMLGYHASPGDASMLCYSRDAMAGPLRKLAAVIEAVRTCRFDPDATRSGRHMVPRASSSAGPKEGPGRGVKRTKMPEVELVLQTLKKMVHIVGDEGRTRCDRPGTVRYATYCRGNRSQDKKVAFCKACYA